MKEPAGRPKKEKETKEIREVLCNFHDVHEVVKYDGFDERSYVVINVLMKIFQ